ncbi:unnamed protein product [Linum trigynum]|uniref:Uncharacterized protein n=1 Tax=Linum trigynum TaxID=586398 RepID=A0AAV2CFT6_9ROSI
MTRVGSHQAVKVEIKTSSWFMEAKVRASTPSSYDRATRLNTNPTRHRGHQVPTNPKTGQGPPRRWITTSQQDGSRSSKAMEVKTKTTVTNWRSRQRKGVPKAVGATSLLAVTKAVTPSGYK